jgi:hypothetical protein
MLSVRTIRDDLFGQDFSITVRWIGAPVGLLLVAGIYAFGPHFVSQSVTAAVLWLFGLLGVCLAVIFAYLNRGLFVCKVGAPDGGAILFYGWLTYTEQVAPVALPFSFHRADAIAYWLPTTLLFGTVSVGIGLLLRWMADSVPS